MKTQTWTERPANEKEVSKMAELVRFCGHHVELGDDGQGGVRGPLTVSSHKDYQDAVREIKEVADELNLDARVEVPGDKYVVEVWHGEWA